MEEELTYVTVNFKKNCISKHEKPNELEIIYDEVKTWTEQTLDTKPAIPDDEKRAPLCTLLHLVAAGLGIICIILLLVVVILSIHFSSALSENTNLTAQKLQLWTEMTELGRQTEELTRQRDGLNWTMEVIMEHKNFPVEAYCPQKVCKPCMDGWVPFQSKCYFFSTSISYYDWKSWHESRIECRRLGGDLVVIESQEEQEFINNHTIDYNDEMHGYWLGLSKTEGTWAWVDRSNFTVTYWTPQHSEYYKSCGLSQPRKEPLANWLKVSCEMWNRWICETRALIKPD
ncbi:C-type lectin domain family 7 member A-like [Centropristis striata]|uniref:C-type lectin domain family 7 member A-like n=1 Tax=Centropristis striata TaxID=184440 RepID=UPI0027E052BF|nr:C-type lectin domain family 7 member A-like [Centropristis striata]